MIKIAPFKSKAQMRLFFAKENSGEIPKGTAKRWANETPKIKSLPEHVKESALSDLFIKLAKSMFNPIKSPPLSPSAIQQDVVETVKEDKMKGMTPVEYRNEVTARTTGIARRNRQTPKLQL